MKWSALSSDQHLLPFCVGFIVQRHACRLAVESELAVGVDVRVNGVIVCVLAL